MGFCASPMRPCLGRYCLWAVLGALAWAVCLQPAVGQDGGPTIVHVEEDWELVVATPDPTTDGPQVATLISPLGSVSWPYAIFELNSQGLPEYTPGGLQIQVWQDEWSELYRKFPNGSIMATSGETVRWTQTMDLTDGKLTFEIVGGSSTTWGTFGGQGYLKLAVGTTLTDLNLYSPGVSVANSGVAYAGNRVSSLVLKRVRLISSTGEVFEDTTERTVVGP